MMVSQLIQDFLLKSSVQTFKDSLWDILDKNPKLLEVFDIKKDDIEDIILTSATELEFWVKTPNDTAEI